MSAANGLAKFGAAAFALLWVFFASNQAAATTIHGDFFGNTVSFLGVQETTQTAGDPEPLFGAPSVTGNQLLFFPSSFSASAVGAGGADSTASLLETTIMGAGALDTIDTIVISEFGDVDLSGLGGAATNASVSMSGFVTVLEDIGGPIAPVIIPFLGSFAPDDTFSLPDDLGTLLWSGEVLIDVAAQVPNATKAQLSFNNSLDAFSESGTSALIQKKVVSGPSVIIEVIPEPGSGSLLLGGLLALALRAHLRRA